MDKTVEKNANKQNNDKSIAHELAAEWMGNRPATSSIKDLKRDDSEGQSRQSIRRAKNKKTLEEHGFRFRDKYTEMELHVLNQDTQILNKKIEIFKSMGMQLSLTALKAPLNAIETNKNTLETENMQITITALYSNPNRVSANIEFLKEQKVDLSKFTKTHLLGLPPESFKEKLSEEAHRKGRHAYSSEYVFSINKERFMYLISRKVYPKELPVFKDIYDRLEQDGRIRLGKEEIKDILDTNHVVIRETRMAKLLKYLEKEQVLARDAETNTTR